MFSERIKEQRNKLGLSQAALADKIGVTQQAVGKWERGKALPDIDMMRRLADFFSVSIDYLLGRTNEFYFFLEQDSPLYNNTLEKIKQSAKVANAQKISLYDNRKGKISAETLKKLLEITEQIKKELAGD